ncbi:unnamed protein product [Urochloa humidicola]
MARVSLAHPVASLKVLQKLVRDYGCVKGFAVCFAGEIEKLSEAKGMLRLLEKMAEESSWEVEVDGLPRLADIDDALGATNTLLLQVLAIDSYPTLEISSRPSSSRGDGPSLTTDMKSPDYGTIQFSRRLGREFLRGRPESRCEDGSGTKPGGRWSRTPMVAPAPWMTSRPTTPPPAAPPPTAPTPSTPPSRAAASPPRPPPSTPRPAAASPPRPPPSTPRSAAASPPRA